MSKCCIVCNSQNGIHMQHASNLFGSHNTLNTGNVLSEVLSNILDKKLVQNQVHTNLLCKKCLKMSSDYDGLQSRIDEIKKEMLTKFKESLTQQNIDYDTYGSHLKPRKQGKQVVLSSAKLQPLSQDMLVKVGKLPLGNIKSNKLPTKVTNVTSIAPAPTTSNVVVDPLCTTPMKAMTMKVEKDDENEITEDTSVDINEDNSLTVMVPPSTSQNDNLVLQVKARKRSPSLSSLTEFITLGGQAGEGGDSRFVFSDLQVLDDDDDDDTDAQTYVLEGDNGNILRMIKGQKLIYQDGEISFVPYEEHDDGGHDADGQDSNDESQIELQVSGDEETANAIIAAAKEQGGAFIKVDSGEMFQVKTIRSKSEAPMTVVVKEGDAFKCLMCEKDTEQLSVFMGNSEAMMQHLKMAHEARIYICQFCDAVMRKRTEYNAHISSHAQKLKALKSSNIYECSACSKSYNSRTLLAEHMNMHTGARPYSCEHCSKTYASKYTLQAHIKTHMDRPRPYKCSQCDKAFFTNQNLVQHVKTHSGIKNFICNVCNKAFSTQHNLEVHSIVHSGNKPFVCTTCGKGFARRAELRDHNRTHTGERPFKCAECDARFAQRSNLHSHRRATHLADRRYHCQHCPKRFKRRRLLEYHIKGTHTGERPLRCDVCGATFVYPEHYRKHLRIHTGEKPYNCEICGKSFNSRDNRNMHRFVHSDKKPYECVRCGAGYMRKQHLYAHIHASGHLSESIVVNQPRVPATDDQSQTAINELEQASAEAMFELNEINEVNTETNELVEVSESTILEAVDAEQLREITEQAEIDDGQGGVMRLIPVQLADGNSGWVALQR